jgi:hypothetical protein
MLLASFIAIGIPAARAQATTLELVPTPQQAFNAGELVTFSAVVSDITDLYGFGLKIEWDITELAYFDHELMVDTSSYPNGVLHPNVAVVKNDVDIPGGIYEAAATSLSPAPGFDGSGIIFNITFQVMYVPWDFEITPDLYTEALVEWTKDDLADSGAVAIPHTTNDGVVQLMAKTFIYPPVPMLKVDPALYEATSLGEVFDTSVLLMGNDSTPLDSFWDVAGIDVYMHYNSTLLEVLDVQIDPTGTFATFWSLGIFEIEKDFSTPGVVHVAFIGYGEPHFAPFGVIEMFRVTFNATYESESYPPPCTPITLLNPQTVGTQIIFDSIGGLIDPSNPVGVDWFRLSPNFGLNSPHTATSWVDDNMDTILSAGDHLVLEGTDGFYFNHLIDRVTTTLNLTQLPFQTVMNIPYFMDGTYGHIDTSAAYTGLGNSRLTGNFSLTYPADSVNYFEVTPQIGAPYNLTNGVDFTVNPDGTIDLHTVIDEDVINEYMGAMPLPSPGWPPIQYIASGFDSVYLVMPNGTSRYARCLGYRLPPPNEFWYEPPWPFEVESWWASGYYAGPWVWPDGTDVYINYTAAVSVTIDYNAFPDPNPRYIDYDGTFADYLATVAGAPENSTWTQVYPTGLGTNYVIIGWDDNDASTDLSVGDKIYTDGDEGLINYLIAGMGTNIYASEKPWICSDELTDDYFGLAPIVSVAGFPHPERDMCPWHNAETSIPLPHVVENGVVCAPFKPSGGFIDIYTQYPDPFGGQGAHKPSDMFWPQKEMHICANVTYADWPEQNKDVAFQVLDPHGQTWGIYVNRTNDIGVTCVRVRLPWPCDDPEYYFGVWTVIATVDVACIVVNDTMQFKYDYKVRVWDVTLDKTEYKHCEDINVTISFGSYATQQYNITLAVTATDASGVPFDFAYTVVTIGHGDHQAWCTYANGTVNILVHVEKFARPPVGTIYVVAMSDLPINGGGAETPVYEVSFTILAEWA